ncbi:MAG: hypothetical protein P8Q53_04500, partial [Flavobacteriaceae bacterium]|nr:hypothetical protein [Flavobacteriaceae bacterium]
MKTRKITVLLLMIPFLVMSQKEKNGKVYKNHPAIEIVNQFNKAYVDGDVETLKSLVSDDFKMWNSMNNNPNYKGGDINNLTGQSAWMNKNFVNMSIENRGSAYSDAIEYKDDGTYVYTFQMFTAWDKNNGFKIKTPRNGTFIFDKEGKKIRRFLWSDNQAAWDKWSISRETVKNGVIYKDHPSIGTVRKVYYHLAQGNIEKTFQDFGKNARIYDSNLTDKDYNSLEEQIESVTSVLSEFEIVSIDEVGYPDYLDYEGNGGVALSWWKFTFKNKKSGEMKTMKLHSQMWFNSKGKIGRE